MGAEYSIVGVLDCRRGFAGFGTDRGILGSVAGKMPRIWEDLYGCVVGPGCHEELPYHQGS